MPATAAQRPPDATASDATASDAPPAFVDTPRGLFTAGGTWFHVREDALRRYAAPVLDLADVPTLLARAECWLRLPQTLAVWSLLVLLAVATLQGWPLLGAALGATAVYAAAYLAAPAFPFRWGMRAANVLERAPLQGLAYVLGLSALGMRGATVAVGVGLAGFVLLRWGLVERLLAPLLRPLLSRLYPLPRPDQTLRALVVRLAHAHRRPLPALDALRRDVIARWHRDAD